MPIVADASVAIRGDMSGFNTDLRKGEAAVGGFAGRIKKILSPSNVVGAAGLFGVGLGVRQLVGFAGEAAAAYGELEQTVATVDAVFEESAGVIHEWGKTAVETAGMSQQTFMSSAAIMGQTLKNMGFTVQESAELTTQLLQRAADLAIAYGKRPQDALIAITAAMRGERDTIEKFGVAIKQVDVNARISALGLDTSTAAAKKNAEAMAVVQLVLEQSADSAGRFAEGADSSAVQMAKLNAEAEDFIALQVGDMFAGIQRGAFKVATAVGEWRAPLRDALDGFALFFGPQRTQIIQAADEIGMSFGDLRDRIAGLMEGGDMTFEVAFDAATASTDAENSIRGTARGIKTALDREAAGLATAYEDVLADPMIVAMLGGQAEAERIAAETPGGIAQAMLDNQFSVEDAVASLLDAVENGLDPMDERMQIQGFLSSTELANGLASPIPAVRQRSLELQAAALSRLDELPVMAWGYGYNTANSLANGMEYGKGLVITASDHLAGAAAGNVTIESEPPVRSSPLYGITKWGGNIARTIADGIYGNLGVGEEASAALAGSLARGFLRGHKMRGMQFGTVDPIPLKGWASMGNLVNPSPTSDTGGFIPGPTYNVYVKQLPEHPTLSEIGGELRRLGEMGKLPGSKVGM